MKKIISILFLMYLLNPLYSQIRRDAVWCFGDSALIDFNYTPPLLDFCFTRSRGSACSIADSSGNLLFYAHSCYLPLWLAGFLQRGVVLNSNHQVMENGDSLYVESWYKEMIIVPDPGNFQTYYLFHTGISSSYKIYYSIIDLSFNGGLGKVTSKNILLDSLNGNDITECVTAIKHGNGRDWWVFLRTHDVSGIKNNTFYKFLVTPTGISSAMTQNIGLLTSTVWLRLYFNHAGNKLVLINALGLVEMYSFDRCTGQLSNMRTIHSESLNPLTMYRNFNWSAEFSPNDSLLYVSTSDNSFSFLYQYDVTSPNIPATKTLIDSLQNPGQGGELKLAPDGKIYWAGIFDEGIFFPFPYPDSIYNQYNMYLSVINQPNNPGFSCDFQKYSFYLGGKRSYLGLPNNPNYDMLALGGSICDTLGLPNFTTTETSKANIVVSPNPFNEFITIENEMNENLEICIFNSMGEFVFKKLLYNKKNELDLTFLPAGIYTMRFLKKSGITQKQVIKIN